MSVYRAGDVVQAASGLRAALVDERARLASLRAQNKAQAATASQRRNDAARSLARALLPELTSEAFATVARSVGPAFLGQDDPVATREARRAALTGELAAIEADPRWIDRERLRAPRVGTLVRAIAELEEFSAWPRDLLARAEHPRLARLLAVGYGSDDYEERWWRRSYYADWKAGDEILERFPGKTGFGELRDELLEAQRTLAVYETKLDALRREVEAGVSLERRGDELRKTLVALDATSLEEARERLAGYLIDGDMAAIGERLAAADPAGGLGEAFKLIRGLAAKTDYLVRIGEEIDAALAQINEQLIKAERDVVKWGRPKNQWQTLPAADFEKRYLAPRQRWRKRREHWNETAQTVWRFEDYGRASFVQDFLWWDLMTDGRLDGDFIPEVASFHREHPDYQYAGARDHDEAEAAAAASTAASLLGGDDAGASAGVDPS